ncbi:DUF1439 domain-containing protein [Noviherbaspirillum saxi]|uniref:DUF1439 domain-containing protein n=1 Tax=Noviherbaspirillum saxi TaxID=2320863 RepID=A0A3A3FX41_9BURK|nr:DUF1439 domain-containing protein [Noviherbaspirillum saxi]
MACQILVLLLLVSCAAMMGPQTREIPLAQLQESIAKRFPFNNRYLQLLDIRVTNPRVALQPEGNRILTSMDISVAPPFLKQSWSGNFAVSGRPQVDLAQNALVLGEPQVEALTVNGLDPLYANQVTRLGGFLAEQLMQNLPLYTFKPEELRYAGTRFNPARIATTQNSVVVTFEPVK